MRSRFMKPLCYNREGVFGLLGDFSPFASWSSPRPRGTRRCPPSISRRLSRRFPVALNLAYLCIEGCTRGRVMHGINIPGKQTTQCQLSENCSAERRVQLLRGTNSPAVAHSKHGK